MTAHDPRLSYAAADGLTKAMDSGGQHVDTAEAFDSLAASGPPERAFLRHRWFSATAPSTTFIASAPSGKPLAAFALSERRKGPLAVREVGGCYWPFRGVPIAKDATRADLAKALEARKADLGSIWRLGPVESDDACVQSLIEAAGDAGWRVLTRPLGQVFELDLAALTADGKWPSSKTRRKNRWRKRRLEEDGGAICEEFFTGADWTEAQRDAMAAIEAASWLGKLEDGGDTKFRDPAMRSYWEGLCEDPLLAGMLFGSLMWIGDVPAAFTFGVEAGGTRYYIANNYDERFTQFGPGRVLLYDDFARAAEHGIGKVSWGLGDAGYKSEMGAQPGPEMADLLFVRSGLLASVARRLWERPA